VAHWSDFSLKILGKEEKNNCFFTLTRRMFLASQTNFWEKFFSVRSYRKEYTKDAPPYPIFSNEAFYYF